MEQTLREVAGNTGYARSALAAGTVPWTDGSGAFHIRHSSGMSLVWGPGVEAGFDAVIAQLRAHSAGEWLQIDPRWHHLDWAGALGDRVEVHRRIEFALDREVPTPTVPGWTVRAATTADFGLAGTVIPADYWGTAAEFLAAGGGMVAERDAAIGAIAFTAYRWDWNLELGVETMPEHRRQGLARAVSAAMVCRVLDEGLTPVWSCREGNVGSQRLAESIGFRVLRRGPYFRVSAHS